MNEKQRERIFHKHLKGLPAYAVAKILFLLNPCIDYRGCSKKVMLDAWVRDSELTEKYGGFSNFTEEDLVLAKTEVLR